MEKPEIVRILAETFASWPVENQAKLKECHAAGYEFFTGPGTDTSMVSSDSRS